MLARARGFARAIKLYASLMCFSTNSCERECILCMLLSLMWYAMHVTICGSWMIMAWLYGIFECKQHELYDMKHDKLFGIITPIGICIKFKLKMRMTWSMERDRGIMIINDKSRSRGDLVHYVCSCIWGIPLSHHEGTDAYTQWQDNDRYALHSAAVTVTSFNGSRHKGLPKYAHRIRKVAQHVEYMVHVHDYPLGQHRWEDETKQKIGPIISLHAIVA